MTTFAFPSSEVVPTSQSIIAVPNSGSLPASPFTGYVQTFSRSGAKLGLSLSFQNMKYNQAQLLQGFFLHLHGQEHRFTIGDHSWTRIGVANGTVLVNGAGQSGFSLVTDGWTGSTELKSGDRISFPNANAHQEIKIITSDVTTDTGGNATVPIFPDIHSSPANNASIFYGTSVIGTYKLVPGAIQFDNEPGDWTSFTVQAIEDAP